MKRIIAITFFLLAIPTFFLFPIEVKALTLQDLYNDLKRLETEAAQNKDKINKTEAEIKATEEAVNKAYQDIEQAKKDIEQAKKDIESLNEKIAKKDVETKELVRYLQIASGENAYLEYAFGAQTMTDFIYRMSVIEQLTQYNDNLIKEMNAAIVEANKKKEELNKKQEELAKLSKELEKKAYELSLVKKDYTDTYNDIEDEIKTSRKVIRSYEQSGCKLTDNINTCGQLPADTAFWRPTDAGYISSEYGYRCYQQGCGKHDGIDMAGFSNIYAAASGKVVIAINSYVPYNKVPLLSNCTEPRYGGDCGGGKQVIIHHSINGVNYTTVYYHMSEVYVKPNDIVTKNTVIGKIGNTGNSYGAHLHFTVATGRRFIDYVGWNAYQARIINPRKVTNFPFCDESWYNKNTKFSNNCGASFDGM